MRRRKNPHNKSQLIREYLQKNKNATAREVQEALAANGVKVGAMLVYNVKSTLRRRPGRVKSAIGHTKSDSISMASLLEAKKLVTALGSINEAQRALSTLAKLN